MEYTVVFSEALQQRIQTLVMDAYRRGQGELVVAVMKQLVASLQRNPDDTGELKYHLATGRPVHTVALAPLSMTYAVYETEKIVWVISLQLMSTPEA